MSSSSSIKATVAVIGGTGTLGEPISVALLTEFREQFTTVRVFTRDPSSATAQGLAKKGAEIVAFDIDTLGSALAGVDVIANILPTVLPEDVRKKVNDAAVKSGAKVYFPSEFGLDHRLVDFSGYEQPEWEGKKRLAAHVRAQAKGTGTKVISLYTSVFLDILLGPYLGFDLEKNVYYPYGSASKKFSTTAKIDIGRAVGSLALLALDPSTAATVPDEARIAGSTVSYEEVRDIVSSVKGVPKGEIEVLDLDKLEQSLRDQKGKGGILDYLRLSIGKGWLDHSDNDNELINPGQKLWKWKTVEDQLRA